MFDTIQDKIIIALKEITDIKTVDDYEGQFDEKIDEMIQRFPAVYVDIEYSDIKQDFISKEQEEYVKYNIYIGAKSLRRSIRRASVYSLIKLIKKKLQNNRFETIDMNPLKYLGMRKYVSLPGIIVYILGFKTAYLETYDE